MGALVVERIEHGTLGKRVYRELRELLIAGQVAPGDRLSLRGLAAQLGTSPMPVREAVYRLLAEQAVQVLPNRTIIVPMMTSTRFRELRRIRLALEGLAVEVAAGAITPEELATAACHNEAFVFAPTEDTSTIVRANKDFHFAIYAAARMPVLMQMIEGLWTQAGPVINFDIRSGSARIADRVARRHHARALDALMRGDAAMARAAIVADIDEAGDFILASGRLPT